jgi:hypothetical protein
LLGEVELKNVSVPAPAFSFLKDMLPYQVHSVSVGRLYLRVPLFNLLESPLEIEASDVHVVCDAQDFSSHRFEPRNLSSMPCAEAPDAQIRSADIPDDFRPTLKAIPPADAEPHAPNPNAHTSVLMRLVYAIVQNARVSITGLNIEVISREVINQAQTHYWNVFFRYEMH